MDRKGPVKLQGALIDIDETTGRALRIERFNELFAPAQPVEKEPAGTVAGA